MHGTAATRHGHEVNISGTIMNTVIKYSLRPQKSVAFASRETTLTKYIKIYIITYGTRLISIDRYSNLVFYKNYFETQMLHIFSTNLVKLVAQKPTTTLFWGRREYATSAFQHDDCVTLNAQVHGHSFRDRMQILAFVIIMTL
jgi:hypothetical protein